MNDVAENIVEDEEEEVVVVDALQETFDEWHAQDMSEDDIIENLHTQHNLSYPAAVTKLRVLRKGAGLTRPKGAKAADVQAYIQERHDAGDDRATITQGLMEKFGYTKHSASSTFSVQGGKIGLAGGGGVGGTKKPIDEVVAFARANQDSKRADFVAAMVEELGYTESTSGAFFTYMPFAKEYARQELEANS